MADYIDAAQAEAKLRWNRELTPAELAEKFALHSFEHRVQHLRNLDGRTLPMSREGGKRVALETALYRTHETLKKVGR